VVIRLTAKGELCTDKDTLELFSQVALVQPLLDYRRVTHRLKTWGETYQRHLSPDNRLHPNFLLLGARPGRMSCRTPNIQNLPRDSGLRVCLIAPEGYRLVAADFAQIELRIAGLLSKDPVILSAYENGRDLHRAIVVQVTGKSEDEITIEERKLGKALNFGLLYGASARTFQTRASVDYGLDISLDEAQRFKSIFDQTYSRLRWWQLEQHREAQTKGKIKTVGGRLVSLQNPEKCYTDARNYPIQAAAADLQLLAIQRVHTVLLKQSLPAYLVDFIHDELVLEVREDVVPNVRELLRHEMTRAFLDLFKSYKPESLYRGLVEVGVGQNYADAK
jgi:DNA polymerase I